MLVKTRGIVLSSLKYSDTSLISKIYTSDLGLQSYITQGARSSKSKGKGAMLQPASLLDLVVYNRPNKNLERIKEMRFKHVYQKLPFDVLKRSIAIFMVEVIQEAIKEQGEENVELFDFLFHCFVDLDKLDGFISNFHLHFLLGLSLQLGFYPLGSFGGNNVYFDLQESCFVPEPPQHPLYLNRDESQTLQQLIEKQKKGDLGGFTNNQRSQLLHQLTRYCRIHLNGFGELKSPKILASLLA